VVVPVLPAQLLTHALAHSPSSPRHGAHPLHQQYQNVLDISMYNNCEMDQLLAGSRLERIAQKSLDQS
jgi:hypothetical protein